MQAAGNQLFTGAAFASPSKLSLYSAMMKFATC